MTEVIFRFGGHFSEIFVKLARSLAAQIDPTENQVRANVNLLNHKSTNSGGPLWLSHHTESVDGFATTCYGAQWTQRNHRYDDDYQLTRRAN